MELGWTIVYVKSVEAAVRFYRRAFGLELRFIVETKDYAEMETGSTALAFASNRFAAVHMPAPIRESDPDEPAPGFTISFRSDDVEADYERAIEAGATALSPAQRATLGPDHRLRARSRRRHDRDRLAAGGRRVSGDTA